MNLDKFIKSHPYLYHLTDERNAEKIIAQRVIYSTNHIIDLSENEDYIPIKRTKRPIHQEIKVGDDIYFLRDQRPISRLALSKCLTNNWTVEDFLEHLNARVFMWPTLKRLEAHFNRYENENPIIFRFPTELVLQNNPDALFSRLNSGATRANSYLGGIAPPRGVETFLSAQDYTFPVSSVAEVTFVDQCQLNFEGVYISRTPHDFKNRIF